MLVSDIRADEGGVVVGKFALEFRTRQNRADDESLFEFSLQSLKRGKRK